MPAISDEKEVRSITPTQRIITVAGAAGSLIVGGVIGATLAGPLAATAANTGSVNQLAAASASPSAAAGTFKSNEDATHEAGESATVEAQEHSGQRPGGGSGKFTPNENPGHEQGESAPRAAQETTRLAIWTSPPCGPAVTRSTSSPTLSRNRSPVAPVATMSYSCRRLRLNVANATRSAFLPSWAMMAIRGRSRFDANFTCESILPRYFESIGRWLQKCDGIFEWVAHPYSTRRSPRLFRNRITHSGVRIPPGAGILQKIREQLVAMLGQDRLGVELHAGQRMLPVSQSHHRAILRPRGDLEAGRQVAALHDERVIAG